MPCSHTLAFHYFYHASLISMKSLTALLDTRATATSFEVEHDTVGKSFYRLGCMYFNNCCIDPMPEPDSTQPPLNLISTPPLNLVATLTTPRLDLAFELWSMGAKHGNAYCNFAVGNCLLDGLNVTSSSSVDDDLNMNDDLTLNDNLNMNDNLILNDNSNINNSITKAATLRSTTIKDRTITDDAERAKEAMAFYGAIQIHEPCYEEAQHLLHHCRLLIEPKVVDSRRRRTHHSMESTRFADDAVALLPSGSIESIVADFQEHDAKEELVEAVDSKEAVEMAARAWRNRWRWTDLRTAIDTHFPSSQ